MPGFASDIVLTGSVGWPAGLAGSGTGVGAVMRSWFNVDLGGEVGEGGGVSPGLLIGFPVREDFRRDGEVG